MSRGLGRVERSIVDAVDRLKELEHRPELWLIVMDFSGTHDTRASRPEAAREARRRAAHSLHSKGEIDLLHARDGGARRILVVRRPTSAAQLAKATQLRMEFLEHCERYWNSDQERERATEREWLRWYSGPMLSADPVFNAACFVDAAAGYAIDRTEVRALTANYRPGRDATHPGFP